MEIFLEGDIRRGVSSKSVIAGRDLLLRARERVLLRRLRVQKHGEVLADLPIALLQQLLGCAADDDPVTLVDGMTEQRVTDRAADLEDLHRCMIPEPSERLPC